MKVSGKSILTLESINNGKPKLKPEVAKTIDAILLLMKEHGIDEIHI